MVISSFYNSKTKVLMLTTAQDFEKQNIKEEDQVVQIYNEKEELIAVNIYNYEDNNLNQGIINNHKIEDIIIKYFGTGYENPFIVGKVIALKKHPKSDKLSICQVDLGNKEEQIVCGAANVKEGIKVIVSQVGAVMPNGLKIKPSKLLDEKSNGMITSLYELGLEKTIGKGIAILSEDYQEGQSYIK